MSKKCKKASAGLSFSGAMSASIRFLPKDGTSDTSIPEQGRPLSKSNRLFVNLFRSIVGHSFVESHTFALEMTGKGYRGNIIDMSKIKQLLQLKKSGLSNRQIVKDLRISRDKQ